MRESIDVSSELGLIILDKLNMFRGSAGYLKRAEFCRFVKGIGGYASYGEDFVILELSVDKWKHFIRIIKLNNFQYIKRTNYLH
jgi:hypothetical protein